MEAIERNFLSNDWITLLFIVAIMLLALMKLYKPKRLYGYFVAFFAQGFIEKRAEENPSFFSPFHLLLFSFSMIIITIAGYSLLTFFNIQQNFWVFSSLLTGVVIYYIIKIALNQALAYIFDIEEDIRYFLFTKNGYLYTLSLWLFPLLIIHLYWLKSPVLLLWVVMIISLFRGFLILLNNKKIVFRKLFYFILYFCTLELAPLLILYKTINK